MKLYKVGKVISQKEKYIVFESNYLGERIFTTKINNFEINKITKLFIYEYKNEYTSETYGFMTFNERYLFQDLISLSGVGPKTAMLILDYDYRKVVALISSGSIDELSKIPYVSNKTARQLIFELQEKYNYLYKKENKTSNLINSVDNENNNKYNDLKITLETLGFQKSQIKNAMENIPDINIPLEELVESSINIISNVK